MEGFDPTVIMLVTALLVPIVGAFMAVTPYLMRRGEVFTVTVPTAEQNDPYVKGLKRRYAVIVGAATVAFTLVGFACAAAGNVSGVMVVLIVGSLALTAGGYGLMLAYRAKMTAYKNERGWEADVQESVAVVGEQPVPHAISVKWNLLYLPIMAVTFAVGAIGYAHMPDQIPMHMDFDGTVNRYADKTCSSCGCPCSSRRSWACASHSPTGPSRVRRNGLNPVLRPRRRWRTACSPARRASTSWWAAW